MNYLAARQSARTWEVECKAASDALRAFPAGPMGLTPDHVKAAPEFIAAKARYDYAFKRLRAANSYIGKHYSKERAAEYAARRGTA